MKMTIKNLDQLYSTLKSLSGELDVAGYDARYDGYVFNGADTLLDWFFKNISLLKAGVKDLLVSFACGIGEYHMNKDHLFISTENTTLGLLVVIRVDHGFYYISSRGREYSSEKIKKEIVFLLKHD